MRTILIRPNDKLRQYGNLKKLSAIEPPIWLALLARNYGDVQILDAEVEGLSIHETVLKVQELKAEHCVILATGSHPSAHIQQTDIANNLKSMLEKIAKIPTEVYNYLPFDPTTMGNPMWHLLPMKKYRCHNWHGWGQKKKNYGAVFSSISCPFTCEFCCVKDFYKCNYKRRDPIAVVTNILHLYEQYGVTNFKMMDEMFVIEHKNTHSILDGLINSGIGDKINIWAYARIDTVNPTLLEKLHKAGVKWLAYGIETGSEKIRQSVLKGKFTNKNVESAIQMTKDYGINVVGNYMFGFWEDDMDTLQETYDFAEKLNCEYSNFYCLVAYPGSELHNKMASLGVCLPTSSSQYAQLSPNFKPLPTGTLTGQEVLKFRDEAFVKYHTSTRYLTMMKKKFDKKAISDIMAMTSTPLNRVVGGKNNRRS